MLTEREQAAAFNCLNPPKLTRTAPLFRTLNSPEPFDGEVAGQGICQFFIGSDQLRLCFHSQHNVNAVVNAPPVQDSFLESTGHRFAVVV